MPQTVFLRAIEAEDRAQALLASVAKLRNGESGSGAYTIEPDDFFKVPGAPFAYWVNDRVRSLFAELPPFEGGGRTVKQGLATADDFRFVRAWWEVPAESIVTGTEATTPEEFRQQTISGKRWAPFAKGGAYSPFYADLYLLVDWENDGKRIKGFVNPDTGRQYSRPQNTESYFRPGITWPRRTTSGMSSRPLPSGAISGDKGPVAFTDEPVSLLGLMQSQVFQTLVSTQLGAADAAARSYEVGIIQRVPVPAAIRGSRISATVSECVSLAQSKWVTDELSHDFQKPELLATTGETLQARFNNWQEYIAAQDADLAQVQDRINKDVLGLYGLDAGDIAKASASQGSSQGDSIGDEDEESAEGGTPSTPAQAAQDLVSYAFGCAFGRWDVRVGQSQAPLPLRNAFAPLPTRAPGALTAASPSLLPGYPLNIEWSGILPEDPDDPRHVTRQIRKVLTVLFENPDSAERELCDMLGARELETWVSTKFFSLHIRRYSQSRRRAPIYWQLRSPQRHYGLWFYYPRLTRDLLFIALRDYVEPKLAQEREELDRLRGSLEQQRRSAGESRDQGALRREMEGKEQVVQDVASFRDELKAVADAGYDPDPNDGVLINIAPLHRLVPWKEAEVCYRDLKAGKYPWASMSQRYKFR